MGQLVGELFGHRVLVADPLRDLLVWLGVPCLMPTTVSAMDLSTMESALSAEDQDFFYACYGIASHLGWRC